MQPAQAQPCHPDLYSAARRRLARRAVLAGSAALLAGCAASTPIVMDRAAMASIRQVGLPTVGFPSSPSITVMNTAANQFGLVGAVANAVVRGNRSSAVQAMMAAHALDPQAHFQAALADTLRARNLAVALASADPARRAFLPTYDAAGRDAVLDVFVVGYGFLALDDRDASPFRPTVALRTRMVAADRSVLMQDTVAVNGVEPAALPSAGATPALPTFKDFSELEANPARAVASLRAALTSAAEGVGRRIA